MFVAKEKLLLTVMLTMSLVGCLTSVGSTTTSQTATAELDPNLTRKYTFIGSQPAKPVMIKVAPSVLYGSLILVVNELKSGGAEQIGIALDQG